MARSVPGTVREKWRAAATAYTRFKDGLEPGQEKLFHAFTFLARFVVLAAPFYLLLGSGWDAEGLRAVTAQFSASTLNALGIQASSAGSFVEAQDILVNVTRDSTGWKSVIVFSALVAASRRSWRSKAAAMVGGTVLILGINLLRITSMVYAVTVFNVDYELLHTLLWRWGLTAAVIVVWASWMRFSVPSDDFLRWRGR